MPSSAEHAARVREGLAFLDDPATQRHPYQAVIECFYTTLHMFEATVYDLTPKHRKRHFENHGERTRFLSACRFTPSDPFFPVAADYEALRGLSEQARYLAPAGTATSQPLRLPADVEQAKALHMAVRRNLEALYENDKKKAPWV
jgi:hypothetical protein